ncbi:DinB family protein [Brevibacillus humidisoli]|uniref:DinB family protein n=1 Tax=Brevibacillus humidisoli TaxID=2895522 RepID=UPI001E642963|nr:DinB family protein [Brevibacillus humidisoli]UFJ43187.1 DinB family protein [Brevibacillus humidisoli]
MELLPIWQKARSRYQDTLDGLRSDELTCRLVPGSNSIGFLLRHNAEVEYRFALMFFGRGLPEDVTLETIGPVKDDGRYTDLTQLLPFMEQANAHLVNAMHSLPVDKWDAPAEAPIGTMTPREAIGRLIYHMGHHGGQIALIRKYANTSY